MTEAPRPIFRVVAEADAVHRMLVATPVGAVCSFAAIGAALGKRVDGSTGAVQKALQRARDDNGMEFGSVVGIGYKRLSDAEIVETTARDIERHHRAAQRAAKRLTNVADFAALPPEAQARHNAALGVFAVIGAATTASAVRALEEASAKAKKGLPMSDTLKALGLSS